MFLHNSFLLNWCPWKRPYLCNPLEEHCLCWPHDLQCLYHPCPHSCQQIIMKLWSYHVEIRDFIGLNITCIGQLAASRYNIQPAIQCATWWSCLRLWVCCKTEKGAHEWAWATTHQHSYKCNMYMLPSNSSMHSHMRRFTCRPTPIYLSSSLPYICLAVSYKSVSLARLPFVCLCCWA